MVNNNDLEKRIEELERKIGKLTFPIDYGSQKAIENVLFGRLKTLTLVGGLPIFTSARTDKPKQGEIYITDISGTRKICAYISGTEYCATITS